MKSNAIKFKATQSLINYWLIGVAINFLIAAIMVCYFATDLYDLRTFTLNDNFETSNGVVAAPLVGIHYFSDFQNSALWVRIPHPYSPKLIGEIGLPPLGVYLWKVFSFTPTLVALMAFTIVGLSLLFVVCRKILISIDKYQRIQIYLLIFCFSIPLMVNIDRGNSALIAMSCFCLGLLTLHRSDFRFLNFALFAISVSLKIYWMAPLCCLLFFGSKRKLIGKYIASIFVLNAGLSFTLGTNPMLAVHNILGTTKDQYGTANIESLYGGIGLNQFFLNISRLWCSNMQSCGPKFQFISLVIPVIWCVYVSWIISKKHIYWEFKIVLLLSAIQVVPAVAMPYTAIWTLPVLCLFIYMQPKITLTPISKMVCFAALVIPNLLLPFGGDDDKILNWRTISLLCIFVFFITFNHIIHKNTDREFSG